ncbi:MULTISPECIES: adenylate/guanylate cyclase domain-containing protein [Roseofilum]|uniref:Response regulator n=2 Tax=Roseofilum TaxID=1233426 RepID=A0ABT7BD22_9CYAN|nr:MULTISPECIES: response regulator [Roseofilum]MDJ1169917.1 response regulator [Roseofilum acuticapitatum BLCC-M154]MDJ1176677.1 response regulator [Roseofilum capinflatum BLCC-M114]
MQNPVQHILIVDDDPSNIFFLEELLDLEGYQIQTASSGEQALSLAAQMHPDLILLDIMMPGMDGYEVCRRLREDEVLQGVPIIFLTALDDDDSRLRALDLMGDDYITKPIDTELLLTKISSILRLSQLRQNKANQENKERNQKQLSAAWNINENLSEKFHLFVPEQYLRRIAPQGLDSIQLGNGTEEELTILFCDIRDFTQIAENQAAQQTFAWLNVFFTQMSEAISSHQGFIDKFLGDAIMAVFDRPHHHSSDALKAAVMMRQRLQEFNQNRQVLGLQEPIQIGIGLHTGVGIVGTLGGNNRMDSTVIGDVVNTAARIEGLTKVYGCPAIASKAVIDAIQQQYPDPDYFLLRCIDFAIPRGKQQGIYLYEILGTKTQILDPEIVQTKDLFEQGLQALNQQEFQSAINCFQEVLKKNPADSVSPMHLQASREKLLSRPL